MVRTSNILDQHGKPIVVDRQPPQLDRLRISRRMMASYDAARDSDEYRRYWAHADSKDANSANDKATRHKLIKRSRYESGSNGYYDGIISTHVNRIVGTGPQLRMLTGNRPTNQLVEREFWKWSKRVQLRRKLWCMCHALVQDGESFAILTRNPAFNDDDVQLDLILIEAEQCQTPFIPFMERGYIDGIRFDDNGNVLWYDVLREHPGSNTVAPLTDEPVRVSPNDMLHWFLLDRPGAKRNVPALTSTLNTGAGARRYREATLAAAESAADFNVLLKQSIDGAEAPPPADPFSTWEIEKRMMTLLPEGMDAMQMRAEFPTATYDQFLRSLVSEQARPLSMPYNLASCDSSTYSFASGKLDMLSYFDLIDVCREDGNDLVLDKLFAAWFREWVLVADRRRDPTISPDHQWDWPAKPVIDSEAEANATDTKLKNGTVTLRQVYSDAGQDFEDQLAVMAEDYFGDSTPASIDKMRMILRHTHYPAAAAIEMAEQQSQEPNDFDVIDDEDEELVA